MHVFDEAMRPLPAEVSYPGPYARIEASVPGASNATRTLTIFYRVRQGLVAGDDADELDWNVTGEEWDVPIGVAEAFVTVPRGVPGDLVRAVAHTGPSGGGGSDYTEERGDHFVAFRTTHPLGPRQGLAIVIGWPRGYVARPSSWQETRSPSCWCSGSAGRTGAPRRGGNRSSQSTSRLRGSSRPRRARS